MTTLLAGCAGMGIPPRFEDEHPEAGKILAKMCSTRNKDSYPLHLGFPDGIRTGPKTGRNQPCPCLSGLKFKKCCG